MAMVARAWHDRTETEGIVYMRDTEALEVRNRCTASVSLGLNEREGQESRPECMAH
jgi:hypothetical protein